MDHEFGQVYASYRLVFIPLRIVVDQNENRHRRETPLL
jgi:hypothetical protein